MIRNKRSMKLLSSAVAIAAATAFPAMAQTNWAGFYGGVSVSSFQLPDDGRSYDVGSSATVGGLYLGHNWAVGSNFIVGGEVAMQLSSVGGETNAGDDLTINNLVDVKLRAGTTFGKALVYASVGKSFGDELMITGSDGYNSAASGMNFGIGVDYAINDRLTVGLDYTVRKMTSGNIFGSDSGDEGYLDNRPLSSIGLRAGFRF